MSVANFYERNKKKKKEIIVGWGACLIKYIGSGKMEDEQRK